MGVMMLVDESATRKAAATISGVIWLFTWYSMGTKIGPSSIHLEVSPPNENIDKGRRDDEADDQ